MPTAWRNWQTTVRSSVLLTRPSVWTGIITPYRKGTPDYLIIIRMNISQKSIAPSLLHLYFGQCSFYLSNVSSVPCNSSNMIFSILVTSGCVGVNRTPLCNKLIIFLAFFSNSCISFGSAILTGCPPLIY